MTRPALNALIVEDQPREAELIAAELQQHYDLTWKRVDTELGFLAGLGTRPDIILSDYQMPHFSVARGLEILQRSDNNTPFIVISGTLGDEEASAIMRHGASDFLLKDRLGRLGTAVETAIERRHLRAAQFDMDQRYRATFEHAPVGIMHSLKDRRILHVNRRLCDMLGYTRDELLSMTTMDLLPPEHRESDRPHYMAGMLAGEIQTYTSRRPFIRKDGSTIWTQRHISLVRDAAGHPLYFLRLIEDVSERKVIEDKLHRERQLLRTVIDAMPERIYVKDREGRFMLHNLANRRAHNIESEEQIIGKTVFDLFPAPLAEARSIEDRTVITTGEPVIDRVGPVPNTTLPDPDQTASWQLTSKIPLKDETGAVYGLVGVTRDISERRRAAIALRESERFAAETIDALHKHICVVDEKGTIIAVNKAWREFAAANGGRIDRVGVGVNYLDVCDNAGGNDVADAPILASAIRTALSGRQEVARLEYACHSPSEQRWFEATVTPFSGSGPRRVVIAHDDITERKLAHITLSETQEKLQIAIRSANVALWNWDLVTGHVDYSAEYKAQLGHVGDEFSQDIETWKRLAHPCDLKRTLDAVERYIANPAGILETEFRMRHEDGSYHWFLSRASLHCDADGKPVRLIGGNIDITARKMAEQALRDSEEKFRQLARHVPQVFWMTDADQKALTYISPAYETVTGRSIAELTANPRAWLECIHPDDRERVRAARKDKARNGDYEVTFRMMHTDGSERWMHSRAFPVYDQDGAVYRIAGISEDITEQKRAQEKLLQLAHYDGLTSLPNRVLFRDRLQQTLAQAQRNDWIIAVLFIDLDHFKNINDTLGHAGGDDLLLQVAGRLTACVRTGDTVGRLSGDEFSVILSELAAAQDAGLVAQKIGTALQAPFTVNDTEIFITASIGITLYPCDSTDIDILIRNADTAMYGAKGLGRNNHQFYTADMNEKSMERMQMNTRLRHALERREFVLHFQPKAHVANGTISGFEALLRWQSPDLGLVAPDRFIPLLEESGLIVQVGEWVLEAACIQLREWQDLGLELVPVAVNCSARQLQHGGLDASIERILQQYGIDPHWLEIEITESSLMQNPDQIAQMLQRIEEHGVRLAIDDFGTGYSSLSYLKKFPLHALKIDRTFVRDITTDADDASIVRTVVALAHNLGLKVIAEGVETREQLDFLAVHGCDEAQGYLLSRPVPAAACLPMLSSRALVARQSHHATNVRRDMVLLVDDDPNSLMLVERRLLKDGHRVLTAGGSKEALELLAIHPVGVVVSDANMPGMSGVEFLRRVKTIYPDTVRIMLSGHSDINTLTEAINEGGIHRFFVKDGYYGALGVEVRKALRSATGAGGALLQQV